MKIKTKKILKPIDVDVSLKYTCPNNDCKFDHWLFLREAQAKNFKIVCECGTIFKPKRIQKIEIVYANQESVKETVDKPKGSGKIKKYPEFVSRAVNMVVSFGYPKKDAQDKIVLLYEQEKIIDPAILVKKAISQFGDIK